MRSNLAHRNKSAAILTAVSPELLYGTFFLLTLMVKCFYYQFTTGISTKPFFSVDNLYMLASSLSILVMLTGLILLFFNKGRVAAFLICHLLITVLLIADTNFYRYYYGIITIPVFMQMDIKVLSSVDRSIMSLFKIKDMIYLLDLPVMIAGIIFLYKRGIAAVSTGRRVAGAMVMLLAGFTPFYPIYKRAETDVFSYSSSYVAKSLGVLFSHVDSTAIYIKENLLQNKSITRKERQAIEAFYEKRKASQGNRYRGIAAGKNLIVIQVEALQQFVIHRKINGKEVTPNLNRLIEDSLYFDNCYFQVAGGNTSDAEFLCNTSLYPAKEGAVYYRYPHNTYHSMPKALKAQGYNTYALHAFSEEFWNRTEMYKAIGFDRFVNSKDYVMDEFVGWEGQALSDASFFRQSLDVIDTDKPFYSFFITLSSHHPFDAFESFEYDTGAFEGRYLGNYLKAANYADRCIGQFIEDLKRRGLYENSLIAIYGDHSAVPKHQAGELMELVGSSFSEYNWMKLQKVPLIMHYPGLRNGETDSSVCGEIDVFPTVANLMGIDAPYVLGKDILNSGPGYTVFRNGSVITDRYIYLNNQREIMDAKSGRPLAVRDYAAELEELLKELRISDLIIEKDAFLPN